MHDQSWRLGYGALHEALKGTKPLGESVDIGHRTYRTHGLHFFPLFREGVMPWKEWSVMDERLQFVDRLLAGDPMTELCREFGISRETGYKIFDRYTKRPACTSE
jgi:hypothetical protein